MGDRCYLQVTVRADDEAAIEKHLGHADEREEEGTTVMLTYQEANYGLGNDLEEAASAKVEFYGWHGTGSSYDSSEFCSFNETVLYVYTGLDGGYLINGSTAEERLKSLTRLEECLSKMSLVKAKVNNPLCALALKGDSNE
jgi:hypothetical protein